MEVLVYVISVAVATSLAVLVQPAVAQGTNTAIPAPTYVLCKFCKNSYDVNCVVQSSALKQVLSGLHWNPKYLWHHLL